MRRYGLLIAVAVLAIGIFVGTAVVVERSTESTREDAMAVYEAIRDELAKVVSEAETTLDALAKAPAILNDEPTECGKALSDALASGKEIYDVFLRIRADGTLDCTPGGASKPVDFSGRVYFTKAVAARDFVVGEFLVGKVSRQQVLAVARPVLGPNDDIRFVLVCGLKTDWLQSVIDSQNPHHDLVVEISDASGVLLSYFIGENDGDVSAANRVELMRLPLLPGRFDAEVVIYTPT